MSRKNGRICLLFHSVPEGTGYRENHFSWVKKTKALEYIHDGYAKEFEPKKRSVIELKKPNSNSLKHEIQDYLRHNDIEFSQDNTKDELLELIGD